MVDHLVLSPHPDDGVWSLGGRLATWRANGESFTVVTVFDGDAPVGRPRGALDGDWRLIATPDVRRDEDRRSLAHPSLVGAGHLRVGHQDAALRAGSTGAPRYTHPRRLFGPFHPEDASLVTTLREHLAPCIEAAAEVHLPLGAGRHVDHRLVRAAAETVAPAKNRYYEDFPYPLKPRDHEGLRPVVTPLTAEAVAAWIDTAALHASQARALFGGPGDDGRAALAAAVRARARSHGHGYALRHWEGAGTTQPATG